MHGFELHLGRARLTATAAFPSRHSAAEGAAKSRRSDLPDRLRHVDLQKQVALIVAARGQRPGLHIV